MSKYKLYGFYEPTTPKPFFSVPIFENNGIFFVQVIEDEKINSFEKVGGSEISVFECGRENYFEEGDEALYAVSDKFNESTLLSKSKLKPYLKGKIGSYIDAPFFYRAVSEFCNHVIPEFYSCKFEKDFLARQIISNHISEYVKVKNITLEKKAKKYQPGLYFRSSIQASAPEVFITTEELENPSLEKIYCNFITYAVDNSKSLRKNKAVLDALNISKEILPKISNNHNDAIDLVYKELIHLLSKKIEPEKKIEQKKTAWLSKPERKMLTNSLNNKFLNNESVTSDSLSLIIYITSRFIQEVKVEDKS
ncbi:hypothetical protein [Cellvibrio sp. UBA7671]|uniref:hypothetical protein n=1 Tax=Cellvibrio sp. UBA7671 TaxID=1946312 RepID=UPI002F35C325